MTKNQQSCDKLNKKYSKIIVWHLTLGKLFWWGPTPVNNFQPRSYFCMAWPMPEVYGSCMKLIIISEKICWYVTPPWNNIAKVAVISQVEVYDLCKQTEDTGTWPTDRRPQRIPCFSTYHIMMTRLSWHLDVHPLSGALGSLPWCHGVTYFNSDKTLYHIKYVYV
jgi:hypothetical protein